MPRIQQPFLRLAVVSGFLAILGTFGAVPAGAATPTGVAVAHVGDPAIGPHAAADAAHGHDALHFTPATTAIPPRRMAPSIAGSAPRPYATIANGGALRREVLGFAPYWELSQQANWNYSLLSTVAYFGLDLNGDGSWDMTRPGWAGWNSQQLSTVIADAHQAGDRVVVVIKGAQGSAGISQLVTNETYRQTAITNTINAIASKSLDGVNVDLEGNANGDLNIQAGFTTFIRELSTAVHNKWPTAYVTVDTYSGSASWDGGIFKIGDLAPLVDGLFDMAYDMGFSDIPGHAAPNAPLNPGAGNWPYNDTTSVSQYLTKAPASKILLGVPYYGYKYCTVDTNPYSAENVPGHCPDPSQPDPAKKTVNPQSASYAQILDDFTCAQQLQKSWDNDAAEPWASWSSPASGDPCGGNHNSSRELYYDNAQSLGLKYDLVNTQNLQGTGMWALGFDGSSKDLWNMLAEKFTGPAPIYYFAEGFTGGGFSESLSLFMPGFSGVVYIDYYTENGHLPTFGIQVSAGKVTTVDVNQYVHAGHNVSAVVTFPAPGVAERVMHFNTGTWHGSTANVGVTKPATEWDFAEGSTLGPFNEYLTLQNPSSTPAPVTINYFTDGSGHPTKGLTLPANSRTTVPVFMGDLTTNPACTATGSAANCGVGRGVNGVSAQVLSPTVPIVVERPMYVNGFDFGDGIIRDGHNAFGVNATAKQWNFAEGNTLRGFREYLTLQNPGTAPATVTLKYVDTSATVTTKTVQVASQSRLTVAVFGTTSGVGSGVSGVSVQVTSDVSIVAERPMYMVFNFGSGVVAGAHDVTGSTTTGTTFEFANASTAAGENDYLTIQNLNATDANLTISYYGPGGRVVRHATMAANSRHTIPIWAGAEGTGPNVSPLGIVVVSDQPVLIEEPTYNASQSTYGATDTLGYVPVGS